MVTVYAFKMELSSLGIICYGNCLCIDSVGISCHGNCVCLDSVGFSCHGNHGCIDNGVVLGRYQLSWLLCMY